MQGPVETLEIITKGIAQTSPGTGVLQDHAEMVSPLVYLRSTDLTLPNDELRALATLPNAPSQALDLAHELSALVSKTIKYDPYATQYGHSAAEALHLKAGVCQDQSHLLISLARINHLPARYVVGYLHSDADGNAVEASHAWVEIYIDGLGWVGFDATNQQCPDERYVRLCSGLDAVNASPIRGVRFGTGTENMSIDLQVNYLSAAH